MSLIEKISEIVYAWMLNARATNYKFFQNGYDYGNGMEYLCIALLVFPLLFAAYFYFVQAKKLTNATRNAYLVICALGLLSLIVASYVIMYTFVGYKGVFLDGNMFKIALIDVVYYALLYQLYSWFMKGASGVPNLDLWSSFFK